MSDAFSRCLELLFAHEGGFVNHPADPGGATNYGITLATLARHRGRPVTADDVRRMPKEEAAAIYRSLYWAPLRCDDLPPPLALLAFDAAVNCGPARAATWLQRAVGATPDGKVGPATIQRVGYAIAQQGGAAVMAEMLALRIKHHADLPTWTTFGLGWSRRLAALPFQAMQLMEAS